MFSITNKLRMIITLGAVGAALASSGVASAASVFQEPGTAPVATKPVSIADRSQAFPSGVKGSGSEATCGLWNDQLQQDQDTMENTENVAVYKEASAALAQDQSDALEAGCIVTDAS